MARRMSPLTAAALAEVEAGSARFWPLFQRLEAKIGPFWQINDGGVHAALRTAKGKGWVSVSHDDDGRDVYAITQDGSDELRRWGEDVDFDVPPLRDDMYVRLLYGAPTDDLVFGVEGKIAETRAKLRDVRRLRERADSRLALLALEGVLRQLETHLDWLVEVHAQLGETEQAGESVELGGHR